MGHKILIIDDEPSIRLILNDLLVYHNFEIAGSASNGREGIEKYKELNPDIVILDVMMPGVNGLQTLKTILSINPKAKVIMLTALGQIQQVKQFIQAGARDYIVKPFDIERVVDGIQKVIQSD